MQSLTEHRWKDCWRQAAALIAILALAGSSQAVAQSKPYPVLRGSQAAGKAPAAPPALGAGAPAGADLSPIPRFQDAPAPRFSLDPAPRLGGLARSGGAAQCRQSCAQDRYLCLATDEADVCGRTWSQCVVGCPESSQDPL